ncbi:MAG: hypothetical protein HY286_11950 [Planctomycetes bacterium]|nr:hypothetical protein [Planctomycetota bacterium]
MKQAIMTETNVPKRTIVPKPLTRNLHIQARRPRFQSIGGPVGLAILLMTAVSVALFGYVAWQKYGTVVRKVFATNVSSSFKSRADYFKSRLDAIDSAGAKRRFGFFSLSTNPRVLKVYHDGDSLVIDASDARDFHGSIEAARTIPAFGAAGADVEKLIIKLSPPRDNAKLAGLLKEIFIKVLDGAEENLVDKALGNISEITMNDLPDDK